MSELVSLASEPPENETRVDPVIKIIEPATENREASPQTKLVSPKHTPDLKKETSEKETVFVADREDGLLLPKEKTSEELIKEKNERDLEKIKNTLSFIRDGFPLNININRQVEVPGKKLPREVDITNIARGVEYTKYCLENLVKAQVRESKQSLVDYWDKEAKNAQEEHARELAMISEFVDIKGSVDFNVKVERQIGTILEKYKDVLNAGKGRKYKFQKQEKEILIFGTAAQFCNRNGEIDISKIAPEDQEKIIFWERKIEENNKLLEPIAKDLMERIELTELVEYHEYDKQNNKMIRHKRLRVSRKLLDDQFVKELQSLITPDEKIAKISEVLAEESNIKLRSFLYEVVDNPKEVDKIKKLFVGYFDFKKITEKAFLSRLGSGGEISILKNLPDDVDLESPHILEAIAQKLEGQLESGKITNPLKLMQALFDKKPELVRNHANRQAFDKGLDRIFANLVENGKREYYSGFPIDELKPMADMLAIDLENEKHFRELTLEYSKDLEKYFDYQLEELSTNRNFYSNLKNLRAFMETFGFLPNKQVLIEQAKKLFAELVKKDRLIENATELAISLDGQVDFSDEALVYLNEYIDQEIAEEDNHLDVEKLIKLKSLIPDWDEEIAKKTKFLQKAQVQAKKFMQKGDSSGYELLELFNIAPDQDFEAVAEEGLIKILRDGNVDGFIKAAEQFEISAARKEEIFWNGVEEARKQKNEKLLTALLKKFLK